ncbi:hypothetical protein Tco_0276290 [Tanacetum coccineum]
MKSIALKTRLARKTSLKKKGVQKGYVSKQERKYVKSFKGEPYVHKDLNFEDLDDFVDVDDTLDYIETEDDQDDGRTSSVVLEEKEIKDKRKKVTEEEPTKVSPLMICFIQQDKCWQILAEDLQKGRKREFNHEQRAKFLYEYHAAQRTYLSQQRLKPYQK